jgi:hypothetical protein
MMKTDTLKDFTGRWILAEMITEYTSLCVAPFIVLCFKRWSLQMHAGYGLDGGLDVTQLFYSFAIQLALELFTDIFCWSHEEKEFNVKRAWILMSNKGRVYKVLFPALFILSLNATSMMVLGFNKPPDVFALCCRHPATDRHY